MKVFHCDHCGHLAFFENVECVNCGHRLAYAPTLGVIASFDEAGGGTYTSPLPRAAGRSWRLCENYARHNVCNWVLPTDHPHDLCLACRLTRTIPDPTQGNNRALWYRLEVAKRRLVYTLLSLGLPLRNKWEDAQGGLAFDFLADPDDPNAPKVMTGHAEGVITVALAEADDAERERRRLQMREPYRTLLGHFRHEVGHYYWDRLVRDTGRLDAFRARFGDEQLDYAAAVQRHYANGPPDDWQERFVSAYATMHPWEDWAETFAHYLHMVDTLETAADLGLSLLPRRLNDPALVRAADPVDEAPSFDAMLAGWGPITYALNNLNRGMGLPDAYPFVLSPPAIEKLRFVHETVRGG